FELGGDSILSIQVVSRARAAGLSLMPRDLFLHQSVASLAANLGEAQPEVAEQGPVVGPAPLTPIQHWLFETQTKAPEHFDKAVLFDLGASARPRLLLAVHHLVVDGVSWRILLEDLDTAYRQAAAGEGVHLGPKTTSFRDWALALSGHVAAGGLDEELGYWSA